MSTRSGAIQVGPWRWKVRHAMYVWLVLLLLLPVPATTAQAAEPVIVVVGDGTPASCTNEALRQAIEAAPVGSTIKFNCGPDPVTIVIGSITLNKNLTIDGGELITFKGGSGCVFCINDTTVNVQFENFTLIGASIRDGRPINNRGTLTMRHVTVSHNIGGPYFGYAGGGITNLGTLTIEDSIIIGNATGCMKGVISGDGYSCNGDGGGAELPTAESYVSVIA